MPLLLHKYVGSSPSRAVLITLDLLGVEIPTVDVNPLTGEQFDQNYMKKNHLHTVPILEDGDDFILTDSHVIMTYLVQKYKPDSDLYPKDLKVRSTVDQRMYLESTVMTPKLLASTATLKKQDRLSEAEIAGFEKVYGFLDKFLESSEYLATNHLTLADVSCVASLAAMNMIVPVSEKFPNLLEWFQRLHKEPWFQKFNVPGVEIFKKYLASLRK